MREKVHVLNRVTGVVMPAVLTDKHPVSSGQLVIVLFGDAVSVDSWPYEVLPFPMEDELGATRWSNRDAP